MMFISGLVITSYIFDLSELLFSVFKRHSVVKSYGVLLYEFLIHIFLIYKIHKVHTLFMHEAYPYSLQVYMVTLSIIVSLMGTSGDSKVDLYVVLFTMFIICELQGT